MTQRKATDMFAELLNAPDQKLKAKEMADDLNEEFFLIASTYLQMVCDCQHGSFWRLRWFVCMRLHTSSQYNPHSGRFEIRLPMQVYDRVVRNPLHSVLCI